MHTLLRKSRSSFQRRNQVRDDKNHDQPPPVPPKDSAAGIFQHLSTNIRHQRKSQIDLSTAVESEQSIAARKQRDKQIHEQHSINSINSIYHLRRRLVRKASTFNLHTRHRAYPVPVSLQVPHQVPHPPPKDLQPSTRSERLFPDAGDEAPNTSANTATILDSATRDLQRPQTASTCTTTSTGRASIHRQPSDTSIGESACSHLTTVPVCAPHTSKPPLSQNPLPADCLVGKTQLQLLQAQEALAAKYPTYREKRIDHSGVWVKMATPAAEPPLPYEKLKQITVDACDAALSSTKSYDHAKTENWNTTIINTILSQLVGETSATSNGTSTSPQSKWKFVVNSTIIQHRSNTVDESTGKGHGRRGMHSAAGAYWNNEKDGMWSFKYEAAERMGLDVVIGVVWVWVG